ncbi:hypothetical protein GGI07_005306 [Coemansia sp. Benny D115]|nr:hypothetical protein GGI07_005306 [Coemansia sp. Benny D115]
MSRRNAGSQDEPTNSVTRSLTVLGQSLRRGLTKRSSKNTDRATSRQAEPAQPAASRTPVRPQTPLQSSFAKPSNYTPSPLSRTGGAAAGGSASSAASGGAQLGLAAADGASTIYGSHRSQRIASASSAHLGSTMGASAGAHAAAAASGSTAATGTFRKTIYGSMGLAGMAKSGMNNSSPSLVHAGAHHSAGSSQHAALTSIGEAPAAPSRKGPPPGTQGAHPGSSAPPRDYSFAIAGNAPSASHSAGASVSATKEGYLSKKTDINPSTSLASALSRGWKVYRVVLKGAKLFFYKPPSESEMRAMFPEETAAATNETAGGYFRASTSTFAHDDAHASGTGFPMAPGEVEAGSRAVLFEPGVQDGEITAPLCERYTFGECFTEVDLRSLKFKRYVCVLIFDDAIVVLKRRWVRQGLASSFFGAVSNKMRFGKGARSKPQQLADNSSLVSAELGIQGKGYFTKWKFHSQYALTNVEAIEAASSRFSVTHAPGVLGHLGRESQAGSGRVSLYSIGNSSVSSIMTRTSTVSKDYSGALSSGLVPGFQIFVGGKERVARMFVATTSDAKNNWLSRFAAAKASYARRLRQRPLEGPAGAARRFNTPAGEAARRPTASNSKDAGAEAVAVEDKAKTARDARARLYWGTQRHPELVVQPAGANRSARAVVVGGSKSALVHEMIFQTTQPASDGDGEGSGAVSFARQLVGTYPLFMDTDEFLREFQRYGDLIATDMDGYQDIARNLREVITELATVYATQYSAEQIGILRAIATKVVDPAADDATAAATEGSDADVLAAVDRMVAVAEPNVADDATTAHTEAASSAADSAPGMPRFMSYEIVDMPPSQTENGSRPQGSSGAATLRGRSKTHHGEPEPAVPQIPTVPELIRVQITGLSPSLLLRVAPGELAHQLYLFHKQQLAGFDPRQPRLYIPVPPTSRNNTSAVVPTPSLLTVGAAGTQPAESDYSPLASTGVLGSGLGSAPGADSASIDTSPDRMLDVQRQLMAFTHNEPHFLTRLIHHQLLVELPLNRPARRSAVLQHWVRIGEECRIIGDAVAWAAVAMAVTMAPIARLRETWHGVALVWKDLIVTEWVPLMVRYGIYDSDAIAAEAVEPRPLVIRPQNRATGSSASPSTAAYTYTSIPYYGTIRMQVARQGRSLKRLYEPSIAGSSGGDAGDRVLFAHLGYMYGAVHMAINNIPNIVVERARTSIMRSRASSVSLASKLSQQPGTGSGTSAGTASAGNASATTAAPIGSASDLVRRDSVQQQSTAAGSALLDPALQGHPYLQAYLRTLALNPMKIGDELAESDMTEYDSRFLLSLSLQCEPSVSDQYQQHLLREASDPSNELSAASSALRQAPGSILPLVCPETVPSTNILQWITPAARTPVQTAHTVGRAANASGRAGTFSHASPGAKNVGNGLAHGTAAADEAATSASTPAAETMPGQRALVERADGAAIRASEDGAAGLRHKRSQSFPTNVPAVMGASMDSADTQGAAEPGTSAKEAAGVARADQQISDAAHGDAIYAGATIYAGGGDLALRVLRVQYMRAGGASQGLRFVVEVQGGTLPLLFDLLINGIEHHSAGITSDKGARIQLPGGSAPILLFNRDVFQRTLLASFRHFCMGVEVLDSMRRAMEAVDAARSWTAAEATFGGLLDICENWLGQHVVDFFDSTALREAMVEFLQQLAAAIGRANPEEDGEPRPNWNDLNERALALLPELLVQLLTPSGYTPLDKILDKRLSHAIHRERRSSNASQYEMAVQSPLSLLSVADPDVMLVSLNRLAQTHFARCSFNDWLVAFCLLEMQTHAPLPWYPKKRASHMPSEDDLVVSDIYQVLEQTHRTRVQAQALDIPGVGSSVGAGGVAASTAETSLIRNMPQSIQTMLELHQFIRGWVIRQIVDPSCTLAQRIARIQKFLTIVRLCRKDSHLSSSRVFGGLLNSYMREAGMIPDRQPSYRTNSIKGYSSVAGGSRVTGEAGRRGKRRGGQSQVKYVPSFVERAVASALVSPESRQFARAWTEVATENGTKLDTLEAVLRGARDWSAFDPAVPASPTVASSSTVGEKGSISGSAVSDTSSVLAAGLKPVALQRSQSNPTTDGLDITEDSMVRADCFVPCLGWLLENMVSLCYDTPDTLVGDSRLVNLAKRHRVFIMLCVCDQLVSRCQEAFALPTEIRIDRAQLSTWITQTPLQMAEIRVTSHNETASAGGANEGVVGTHGPVNSAASGNGVHTAFGASGSGSFGSDRGFSFSSPPAHTGGFSRSGDNMPSVRSVQGGFAKRSIANLRSASSGSSNGVGANSSGNIGIGGANANAGNASSAGGANGYYSRKSSIATPHTTPEFGGVQAFGSPPAPTPRLLAFADGPSNTLPSAGGSYGGASQSGLYMRPFARLVTDEVEKVRQEVREREKLERELRDREQAIERQKNERTKMLKRQLKEQQQRRAKNEPLLKMASLMNKVGISARESSIDGHGSLTKGASAYGGSPSLPGGSGGSPLPGGADANRLSSVSATGSMRPRGPALPNAKPANVINLINSTIAVEQGYTKRDFVFRIVTEEGGQYLLQAPDSEQMDDWIAAMRDAATEAAARRLTLFVEEAKKRNNADGAGGASMFMGMGDSESHNSSQQQQQQSQQAGQNAHRTLGASDTTRSRFTAFLGGGASAFGGFGLSSQTPAVPSRGALMAIHQQQQQQQQQQGGPHDQTQGGTLRDLPANVEPKSFGIDLAKLMPDPKVVPVIVEKCLAEIELRGLEEVGIYRVSGAAADVSRLRQMFNVDPDAVDLSADIFYDINVVSGVMKQFLRELPEPLMTYNLYEGFINAASIDDYDERLWAIKDLVHALPTANYTLLKRCVEHLERVTDYEEVNHMYGTNLALVFGPSLLRPPPGSSSFALAMSNLGHAQSVIKNLILQYHWIFNVEEEAEPIEDGEMTAESTPETQAATIAMDESAANVQASETAKGSNSSLSRMADSAVIDEEEDDYEDIEPLDIVSPNKRDSVAPLSTAAQADMDQLALAVNNMTV